MLSATVTGAAPALPSINTNNVFNVVTYGAATGNADNAAYIQTAINAASAATAGVDGGTVEIPGPGTYLCGPLTMKSKVNLQIDGGATLMMLAKSSWPSSSTPFIYGSSIHDVEISGAGTIDGQGADWWGSSSRPNFIQFTGSHRILIKSSTPQDPFTGMVNALTLRNPPKFHLMLKNHNGDITIQGLNIDTDPSSPNTDGMDVGATNMLVENCHINDGDDNIELGGSSGTAADILITNCMFGHGHGVSVGSYTQAGVSNVTVINCVFTNTDNAIRMKSDDGRGGLVQNMYYYNIGMTNIKYAPILIYSYYETAGGNPTTYKITPSVAAGESVDSVSSTTPVWRNIIISNVTATASQPGMIWSRTELPASNIILSKLNITSTDSKSGDSAFALYNVRNVQVVNSQIHPAGGKMFELFNSQVLFTNTVTGASAITLDGTSVNNGLAFFNQSASLSDSTLFGATPISLGGSTLSDGTSLTLAATTPVNFSLGTNPARVSVTGNLTLNSTLNIAAGAGFAPGTYTLFTYTGSLSGSPTLGATPADYACQLDTGTAGQVNLVVASTSSPPAAPTGLTARAGNAQVALSWNASSGATGYQVKRATVSGGESMTNATVTATGYTDTQAANGTTYYYVVSAVNSYGESANSAEVSATPQVPSTNVVATNVFTDTFSGSSINSASPTSPTTSGTSYEIVSGKSWDPAPSLAAGHLKFGIGSTSSGTIEAEARFANPVTLSNAGDRVSLVVTFTNTSGLLTANGAMGFGLYQSGQNFPVAGGLNGKATSSYSDNATGNAQTWIGYVGQLAYSGEDCQILTRPAQTTTPLYNNDQDLVTTGSGSYSYGAPKGTTVGSASTTPSVALTEGSLYTDVLTVTLVTNKTLAVTNSLYSGSDTSGSPLSQFGGVASGSTYLTNTFDALAIGWRETGEQATAIDINRISVNATLTVATTESKPAAPANLTATAGNAQVALVWDAASGATSYDIKRAAVSGGPYTTIATGITSASYKDTSAVNGATYYYVVSAVNGGGESANSSEVSATPELPRSADINSIRITGNGLVMSGMDGTTNGAFYVLASTNIALPLTQWALVATDLFDSSGNFTLTNAISPDSPQAFYILEDAQ